MKTRREFLSIIAGASAAGMVPVSGQPSSIGEVQELVLQGQLTEEHAGDPGDSPELMAFAPAQLQKASAPDQTVLPEKDGRAVALRALELSKSFAASSVGRHSVPPDQVREFLALFGFGLRYDNSDVYVPFCAAGVSYAACRAFCDVAPKQAYIPESIGYHEQRLNVFRKRLREIRKHYFFPSPAVRLIKADAEERKAWMPASVTPLPGWLVVFSWKGSSANHIGIVDAVENDRLHTVEYNTATVANGDQRNGGLVAVKIRPRNNTVLGFVRTYGG